MIQFASAASLVGGSGRLVGNGTTSPSAGAASALAGPVSIDAVTSSAAASGASACVSGICGSAASGIPVTSASAMSRSGIKLSIVEASATTRSPGATSWIVSLDSPTAKVGSTRCRSPISSGFNAHSVPPRRSPVDSLLPCGRPLMTMTLLGGTASVPSSAIGKLTCSPAEARSVLGAERTGGGSAT